jgi:hypothetical protein
LGRRPGEPNYRTKGQGAEKVVDRAFWQRRAETLDDAHARGEIDDAQWFSEMSAIFEAAYLAGDNPRAQSGFGGDETR